jgi:hypothetical protein
VRTFAYVITSMLCAAPAFAQVRVEVTAPPPPRIVVRAPAPVVVAPPPRVVVAPPPAVRFAAPPPLVTIEPGVRVVQDCDEEVFFVGGYYWHAAPDGTWYRSHGYRGGWVVAPQHMVPMRLARVERGHYRHFHGGAARRDERRWERHERHEQRREERWGHHGRH